MRSYLNSIAANYLSLFLAVLVNVCLIPYLLNTLGAELTGIYILLMSLSNFTTVGSAWLSNAGVKLLAAALADHDRPRVREIHTALFLGFNLISLAIFVLAAVASWLVGRHIMADGSPAAISQAKSGALWLGVFVWVSYLHSADAGLLAAQLRQAEASLYRVLSQALFGIFAIVALGLDGSITSLLAAQTCAIAIPAVIARWRLVRRGDVHVLPRALPGPALTRELCIVLGVNYFILSLAQFSLAYADVFLIGAFLGAEAVTAYAVIWKVPEFGALLLGRLSEIMAPFIALLDARRERGRLATLYLSSASVLHLLAVTAAVCYGIAGPLVVSLWVGAEHLTGAAWLFPLAGLAMAFQSVNRQDLVLHLASGQPRRLIVPHMFEAVARIALTVALFRRLGIAAPIVAAVLTQSLGVFWWYKRKSLDLLGVKWSAYLREVYGAKLPVFLLAVVLLLGTEPAFPNRHQARLLIAFEMAGIAAAITLAFATLFYVCSRVASLAPVGQIRTVIRSITSGPLATAPEATNASRQGETHAEGPNPMA